MKEFYCKYILHNIPFYILSSIAVGLIIASFIVPPHGVIDPSVLAAVGEIFAFSSLYTVIIAIERGTPARIRHKDTEIKVGEKEEDQN